VGGEDVAQHLTVVESQDVVAVHLFGIAAPACHNHGIPGLSNGHSVLHGTPPVGFDYHHR
jgi:hypothetical protein